MTNVHVWTPLRYNFEGFLEVLQSHPRFSHGKVKSLKIHCRSELTNDHLYEICTTALVERCQKSVHIFVFDDDEIEEGCGLETLELFIKHLINITKVHPKMYFLFADLVDYLYQTDAIYTGYELTNFKNSANENVKQFPSRNFYKDFRGVLDGVDCNCFNNPNDQGMKKIFDVLINTFIERAPAGAF